MASPSHSPSPSPTPSPLTALTPDALAALIQQLTSPTPTNFRQAETTILAHLSSAAVIDPLSHLLSHPAPEVRHFSAILLRRALAHHNSSSAPSQLLQPVKTHVLPLLTSEPNPAARRGLIALSSYICKLQNSLWPQLTAVAIQLSQSPDPLLRASAFSVFQSLCDTVPDLILPHLSDIARVLSTALSDSVSTVRLAALRAFSAAANPAVLRHGISLDPLVDLLPLVVALATTHPNRQSDEYARIASNVFDVLAVMMDNIPAPLLPKFFKDACTLALSVFSDHGTCRQARSAANEFLVYAIARRPNSARADGIALASVQNACAVIFHEAHRVASLPDDDDDVDDGDHDPVHLSLRILYAMAKRPELSQLVFTNVLSSINTNFSQARVSSAAPASPYAAGYRMIAAISEGCGTELTLHSREVLPQIVSGALDETPGFPTRARALEALGCVCEYLDTDEMSDELIVELANSALDAVLAGLRHKQTFVCKAACVSLEPVLALYVPGSEALRARVGDILRALGNVGADVAEEAVMAIGVLAEHAPDAFNESDMYGDVIQWVLQVMANTAEDRYLVRAAATSAAGALMASCSDHSVVEKLATHAIAGIDSDEAPLRQATFRFFARMADVVGGSVVAVFGPKILKSAVESMERETVNYGDDDEDSNPALFNATDGEVDDEDDDVLEIHTAYLDEKMVAVAAVGAFASACGTDEYVERISQSIDTATEIRKLFGESVPLVDELCRYFQEDVRASAYQSLCRTAVANGLLREKHPSLAFLDADLVKDTFPKLNYCLQEDDDIEVVTSALGSCAAFFGHVPGNVLMEHKSSIVSSLHMMLSQKTICQCSVEADDGADDGNEDDGDAKGDLMEGLGEVIVAMGVALRGYFAEDFDYLLSYMVDSMCTAKASLRNKGTALGTSAAVLLYLNWERCTSVMVPEKGSSSYEKAYEVTDTAGAKLLGIALDSVQNSESRTVRQNAMFLLGVIFAKTRIEQREVWGLLPRALSVLENVMAGGKSGHGALIDNAAGALARVMFSAGLSEDRRLQRRGMMRAVLKCIPVKNDPSENTTIAGAIVRMVKEGGFGVLVEGDVIGKVISCLVSAILSYRSLKKKKSGRIWSPTIEIDVCDEIALYRDEDMMEVVDVMRKVTHVGGEGELKKLNLSVSDEVALSKMVSALSGGR